MINEKEGTGKEGSWSPSSGGVGVWENGPPAARGHGVQ